MNSIYITTIFKFIKYASIKTDDLYKQKTILIVKYIVKNYATEIEPI